MRSLRYSVAVFGLMAVAAPWSMAADYSPKDLLKFRPTQTGVDYDTPTDAAAIEACKVELVTDGQKRTVGYALRDGQGKLLRRFVITNRGKYLNQWSYYQDGFEVYRENDLDGDRTLDECRWLNGGGTRVAVIKSGKIAGWKRLSAEEASKVLVQAFVGSDLGLLESLMATPEELAAAGVPKNVVDKVTAGAGKRAEAVEALQKSLTGWTAKTVWNRFDGTYPHVIPADPAGGLEKDLVLYENAVIFAGGPAAQASSVKTSFLQVPEMIKLGETWKFVELPRAVDPEKPVVASTSGIRSAIYDVAGPGPQRDEAMEKSIKTLADFDNANAKLQASGDKKDLARFHVGRVPLLYAIVKVAKDAEDQVNYKKQIVDSLVAAYQTGAYPKGRQVLEGMIEEGTRLSSYAAYRLIGADFVMRNEEPGELPGQPEEVDGRARGLPDQVRQVGGGPGGLVAAWQLQRVQRRGRSGAAGLYQARRELPGHSGRQEGRRRSAAARPRGQADRHQRNELAGRDSGHVAVSRQVCPGGVLGLVGWSVGPPRATRPGEALRQVPGQGIGDCRGQPGQRAWRSGGLPQGAADGLAADLRGRRHR